MVIDPEDIEWDEQNCEHATRHGVSVEEITQVVLGEPVVRRNRKGRSGDYFMYGRTRGGRRIVVVIAWDPARRAIRPITAWEQQ